MCILKTMVDPSKAKTVDIQMNFKTGYLRACYIFIIFNVSNWWKMDGMQETIRSSNVCTNVYLHFNWMEYILVLTFNTQMKKFTQTQIIYVLSVIAISVRSWPHEASLFS